MSATDITAPIESARPALGVVERYLSLWVALAMAGGIALGQFAPAPFHALGQATIAQVNLPVAGLVWLMIIPMLLKIDLAALGQVRSQWRGIGVTLLINWAVKPFSMAALGWLFIGHVFRPFLPAGQIDSYRRFDSARSGALYGNGVCLVESTRR